MASAKTEQKYAIPKGFAEVGTEAWLRECEALLAGVPAEWNTVAIGKERLRGLIEELREANANFEFLIQSGEEENRQNREAALFPCPRCSRGCELKRSCYCWGCGHDWDPA